MLKYGIKLWSSNRALFAKALQLFREGKIDFLELYIVPDSFQQKDLAPLKKIPITLHAPHSLHNFDIFELNKNKTEMFQEQVLKTADFLDAEYVVVHSGIGGSVEKFKKLYDKRILNDRRIIIENMPKIGIGGELCFGYSLEQLRFIKQMGFNICLDFGHAVKSAFSQGLDYKTFITSLLKEFKPFYFHLCGSQTKEQKDKHLNLFEGDLDLCWLKCLLSSLATKHARTKKDTYLVFEVPKLGDELQNDLKNINYFKGLGAVAEK